MIRQLLFLSLLAFPILGFSQASDSKEEDSIVSDYMTFQNLQDFYANAKKKEKKKFEREGEIDEFGLKQGLFKEYAMGYYSRFYMGEKFPERDSLRLFYYHEGEYENGYRVGEWNTSAVKKETHEKVLVRTANYDYGVTDGEMLHYYADGKVARRSNYSNDSMLGPVVVFYPNGDTFSYYETANNKYHGNFFKRFQNGNLSETGVFYDGYWNGNLKEYFSDGVVREITPWEHGRKNGTYQYFHPNGQLWIELIYEDGKTMEVTCNYKKDGSVREKGSLKNGNGTIYYYTPEEELYLIVSVKEGEIVNSKEMLEVDEEDFHKTEAEIERELREGIEEKDDNEENKEEEDPDGGNF